MKKKIAEHIVKVYNANFAHSTEKTRTRAELVEQYTSESKNSWGVYIVPAGSNCGTAFFASHECVDVSRVFGVSFIVSLIDDKLIGRFF